MTAKYRTQFDISLTDLDLIEKALRYQANDVGNEMLKKRLSNEQSPDGIDDQLNAKMSAIQSVLGKLHNQKIWFAPKNYSPLG